MPCYKCVLCKLTSVIVKRKNLNISFHNFPSDPDRKQAWEEFCGVQTGVVCSEHFSDDCFLGGRDEKNKRRRLVARAVPSIRLPVTEYGTHFLSQLDSEETDTSYYGAIQPGKEDLSESFDFDMAEEDMSEADIISEQLNIISELRGQVDEYKTQLDDTTKKLNEMEVALFERDCIIDELRKKLDDVGKNPNSEPKPKRN